MEPIDIIGHSYGAFVVSYLALHRPNLLGRQVYAEGPCFIPHASKGWSRLFQRFTWPVLLRHLLYIVQPRPKNLIMLNYGCFRHSGRQETKQFPLWQLSWQAAENSPGRRRRRRRRSAGSAARILPKVVLQTWTSDL